MNSALNCPPIGVQKSPLCAPGGTELTPKAPPRPRETGWLQRDDAGSLRAGILGVIQIDPLDLHSGRHPHARIESGHPLRQFLAMDGNKAKIV
jgi:hypothetical protein